jgi:hypothetical protein
VCSVMTPVVVVRPMLFPRYSVNHSAPSGPAVIPEGKLFAVGTGYSVITPAVVMRPILLAEENSVNHTAPSGPAVIPQGALSKVGTLYSPMAACCADELAGRLNSRTAIQQLSVLQKLPIRG